MRHVWSATADRRTSGTADLGEAAMAGMLQLLSLIEVAHPNSCSCRSRDHGHPRRNRHNGDRLIHALMLFLLRHSTRSGRAPTSLNAQRTPIGTHDSSWLAVTSRPVAPRFQSTTLCGFRIVCMVLRLQARGIQRWRSNACRAHTHPRSVPRALALAHKLSGQRKPRAVRAKSPYCYQASLRRRRR